MKNTQIFSILKDTATIISFILTFTLIILTSVVTKGQILFDNHDFEDSSNCDPTDCANTDVSCIPGWWNHDTPDYYDEYAWIYYENYGNCSDESLESCGGDRGMRIFHGTGDFAPFSPATKNPFFGLNNFGAYEIHFNLNIIFNNCSKAIVEVYVDENKTKVLPNTEVFIAETEGTYTADQCYDVKIGITDPEKVNQLTSHEFILFKIIGTCQKPPLSEISTDAVIDNVEACNLLNIQVSTFECDKFCINLSRECASECDGYRYDDPELDDCYMDVIWYPNDEYNSAEIIEECYFASIDAEQCCISSPETGTYYPIINVQYLLNGEEINESYFLEIEYQPCSTVTVSATTTWHAWDISEFARFDLITVESGVTLTIADDLTLKFCEEGKLVINPGGEVILNGTLTADCENGWLGVEVQGKSNTNQYPHSGLYPQGLLRCNPGSKIELAYTAVRLFGPEYEDTGGQIYADSASFINNRCGIYFAPFNNYLVNPGKPRDYFSSIRNCTFDIIEDRPMPAPFIYHINMYKVMGITISGTSFGNHRHIEDASSPKQYGIGIVANDAGFNVLPSAVDIEDEPCLPPCIQDKPSTFSGLGIGVSVHKIGVNRPFQVYGSEFSGCYFGIVNDGVSECVIVLNDFEMGAVQNLEGEEDQVGIALSGYLEGFTIEQNQFFLTDVLTDNSLGIVINEIGDVNNVIRKNKFVEITVGNEAFGINADPHGEVHSGLYYLCNENTDIQMNDFYFPSDITVDNTPIIENYIRNYQGLLSNGPVLAAGNTFSETGDPVDGDFANYGDNEVKYFYDDNDVFQTPVDYAGIESLIDAPPNNCNAIFCFHPCVNIGGFEDEKEAFYSNKEDFEDAVGEEDFDLASYYRVMIDSNIYKILSYIQYDTSAFDRDTLRAWYLRAGSIAGDLLLASDYFDTGEYTDMNNTLDSIRRWYDLTSAQLFDLRRVKYAYGILSARSVFSLTSTDIDSLSLYSSGIGAAASLARGTLAILDTIFTPRYYIPGEVEPRSEKQGVITKSSLTKIKIYPNPITDILTVDVPDNSGSDLMMEFMDVNGRILSTKLLHIGLNELPIQEIIPNKSGVIIYRISYSNGMIEIGKLINLK